MGKGNLQLAFVSLKSVKARGTEGSKELKSDVTSSQCMLTCGGANCSDSVPFSCLGSQLVMIQPFAGGTREADSSLTLEDRRCKGQLWLMGYGTLAMTYCLLKNILLCQHWLMKTSVILFADMDSSITNSSDHHLFTCTWKYLSLY